MTASAPAPIPNLFVIGAPKCATTSLHAYLDAHPEISMTSVKEPQLLAGPDFRERLSGYGRLLDPAAPIRGESSVVYSQYPRWPGVPERISEVAPEARFIYLVRDPLERAVAHYGQHVQDGKERRSLEAALADHGRADSLYLCPSRYATQLRRYLEHFDRERLLLVEVDRLSAEPQATIAAVHRFLGVPEDAGAGLGERHNTREDHRAPTRLGSLAAGLGAARRLLPAPARERLRPLFSRPRERPELGPELAARLREELAPEVEWLRDWSGRSFEGWSL